MSLEAIAPPPMNGPPVRFLAHPPGTGLGPRVDRLPSPDRETPREVLDEMMSACAARDLPRFKAMFDMWAPFRFDIYDLSRIMRLAIEMDYSELISTLLAQGQPIHFGHAQRAVWHRSRKVLTAFLQYGWDINEIECETTTSVLGFAVQDEEMTRWLLDHGADPNQQSSVDLTPLSWAVEKASLSTINLLFERGADALKGEPLHHAINRKTEVVEVLSLLLEKGAPLNGKQYENHPNSWRLYFFMGLGTALHQASCLGNVDAARFLLEKGADVSIIDATDRTPLDWAVKNGHQEIIEMLEAAGAERGPRPQPPRE
ncbi:putative hspc200 [Aspergillus pseudodeflectus]|uniref:Hspc200 n=1 Tax=Aspergillus pseudodeflectus TaxID=176178 RepID=A0ABR4KGH5_9EURO